MVIDTNDEQLQTLAPIQAFFARDRGGIVFAGPRGALRFYRGPSTEDPPGIAHDAPRVQDFFQQGYALGGARLDQLAGQNAVASVYRICRHPANVFMWLHKAGHEGALVQSSAALSRR